MAIRNLLKAFSLLLGILGTALTGCAEDSMFSAKRLPDFSDASKTRQWAIQALQRVQTKFVRSGERGVVDCRLLPAGIAETTSKMMGDKPGVIGAAYYYFTPSGGQQVLVGNGFVCENIVFAASSLNCTLQIRFIQAGFTSQGPFSGENDRLVNSINIPGGTSISTVAPIAVKYNAGSVSWVRLAYECNPKTRTAIIN